MMFWPWVPWLTLTVTGFVLATRRLAWVAERVERLEKPWACDVCLSFWSMCLWAPGAALVAWDLGALWAAPPSYVIVLFLLPRVQPPPPIVLPRLE